MKRRLAAVLLADVVGFSRLMEADEAGTLAVLKQRRREVLEPILREHGGRVVKFMGDGVLIEFGSAVSAVTAALALQRAMAEADAAAPQHGAILLRIGINFGDVIGEGTDIYGDGVNIAARLEALAEPGGICIAGNLFDEVRGKVAAIFEDLGEQVVKSLSRPVRAYRVRAAIEGEAPPARAALSLPDKPSLAVLPFTNMSGDAEQEYFADGMVEDIITELARLPWLFVIARNSSFTYKGRAVDVKQVGRELGVRYVLEGSVRKAGGRVRINGQLIEAANGAHLWADRFDGEVADIFDLQDRVTESVVGVIAPRLEQAEIERAKRKPTESLDAYDYFCAAWPRSIASAQPTMPRRWLSSPRPSSSIPTTLQPTPWPRAATCSARASAGWSTGTTRSSRRGGCHGAPLALGRHDAVSLANAGMALISVARELDEGAAMLDHALALNQNLAWVWHFSAHAKAFLGEPEAAIERRRAPCASARRIRRSSPWRLRPPGAIFSSARTRRHLDGPRPHCVGSPTSWSALASLPQRRPRPAGCPRPSAPWTACVRSLRTCGRVTSGASCPSADPRISPAGQRACDSLACRSDPGPIGPPCRLRGCRRRPRAHPRSLCEMASRDRP